MKAMPILIPLLMLLVLGCTQQAPGANDTACAADAKICPDGSAVGRIGPDCEFAPCPVVVGNDSDEHGCRGSAGYSWCEAKQACIRAWEEACEGDLRASEVMRTAQEYCGAIGNLSGEMTYNPNSRTYWIDIDTTKQGCSPACVVWEENLTAEVNWRCTGLIPPYTVKSANTTLGEILVKGDGMTLYAFSADPVNESACYGVCAQNWPPLLISDTIVIPKGLPGEFGAILRNGTTTQVTYDGMPLYSYHLDTAPGETKGEGVNGKWHVIKADD